MRIEDRKTCWIYGNSGSYKVCGRYGDLDWCGRDWAECTDLGGRPGELITMITYKQSLRRASTCDCVQHVSSILKDINKRIEDDEQHTRHGLQLYKNLIT